MEDLYHVRNHKHNFNPYAPQSSAGPIMPDEAVVKKPISLTNFPWFGASSILLLIVNVVLGSLLTVSPETFKESSEGTQAIWFIGMLLVIPFVSFVLALIETIRKRFRIVGVIALVCVLAKYLLPIILLVGYIMLDRTVGL